MTKTSLKQLVKKEANDWNNILTTIAKKLKNDANDFQKFIGVK